KTGSLCCVAARPHGSSPATRDWSLAGGNDRFWQTNSSFSPPHSWRRNLRSQTEVLSLGSNAGPSSLASYGYESRSWARGERVVRSQRHSLSDGEYVSSPSESFQYLVIDEHSAEEQSSGPLTFSRLQEGASRLSQTIGSTSSHSDGSEFEPTTKPWRSSSSRSFMSNPVHPVTFQVGIAAAKEAAQTSKSSPHSNLNSNRALRELQSPWWLELGVSSEARTGQWISASSVDHTNFSEPVGLRSSSHPYKNLHGGSKCSLCERFLSQRSPWGSRRIVGSGDMPVAAVLSCRHVYHVECLERTTPKNKRHDPPCPQCEKQEENVMEQWPSCKFKNEAPRLKHLGEGGSSRRWTCRKVGDCVMGAVQIPKRSNVLLLDQNPVNRQLLLEGGSGKN
ncbi:Zinc finger RING/FYVE/PHD-type protein, partial [Dioscorea alata]